MYSICLRWRVAACSTMANGEAAEAALVAIPSVYLIRRRYWFAPSRRSSPSAVAPAGKTRLGLEHFFASSSRAESGSEPTFPTRGADHQIAPVNILNWHYHEALSDSRKNISREIEARKIRIHSLNDRLFVGSTKGKPCSGECPHQFWQDSSRHREKSAQGPSHDEIVPKASLPPKLLCKPLGRLFPKPRNPEQL